MKAGAAKAWFIVGTITLILAGGLHALLALRDTVDPTAFAPIDGSVKTAMEGTGVRLVGEATPSMWSAWLGFNIGFGLGVFAFGLLCLLVATHDFKLVERIGAIRPLTIAVSATYFAISIGFFFSGPAIITGIATVCFTIAAVLSVAGRRGEAARSADHHPGRRP